MAALVAVATSASETASQAVEDAYAGLKRSLRDGYKLAATALLEKKPPEPAFQKAVQAELEEQPKVASHPAVGQAWPGEVPPVQFGQV